MFDPLTALRPDLLRYCENELGHKAHFLLRLSLAQLREIAVEKRRFVPKADRGDTVTVPTVPTDGPTFPQDKPTTITPDVSPRQPLTPAGGKLAGLIDAVAEEVAPIVRDTLRAEFQEALTNRPRITVLQVGDDPMAQITLGTAHMTAPVLIKKLRAKVNVWLHGEAGSGKTTACRQASDVLSELYERNIPFYGLSVDETMQAHHLMGHMALQLSGPSIYQRTMFRDAYEYGGVFLADEIDNATNILSVANMAIDSDLAFFPDGPVRRHPHFYFVAGANTLGLGGDPRYNRNRIGAAERNRFAFVAWEYDEALELAIAGMDQIAWVKHVQKLRAAVKRLGASAPADLLISPRASIYGARELRSDSTTTFAELEESYIWPGCSEDDRAKVRAACK